MRTPTTDDRPEVVDHGAVTTGERTARHQSHRQILEREFLAAALYMALVLLAALVVLPKEQLPADRTVVALLLGTAVGLITAHWVAFRLASHLTEAGGVWAGSAAQEGAAQVAGGVAVAVVASAPFLVADGEPALRVSLLLLSALPAVTGLAIARMRGRSWLRSGLFAVSVLALALLVVLVKTAVGH
jgi:hypothetical protein